VELVLRGPSPSCSIAGVQTVTGRRGVNRVHFSGRLQGRPLPPGIYLITIEAVRPASRIDIGRVAVEIVPPGRRLSKAQRTAPVSTRCASEPGAELALIVFGGSSPGWALRMPTRSAPQTPEPELSGVLGVKGGTRDLGPPYVSLPHPPGVVGQLAAALGIALGLSLLVVGLGLTPAWMLPRPLGILAYERRDQLVYGGVASAVGIGLGMAIALAFG